MLCGPLTALSRVIGARSRTRWCGFSPRGDSPPREVALQALSYGKAIGEKNHK